MIPTLLGPHFPCVTHRQPGLHLAGGPTPTLLISRACPVGNLASIWLVDRLGRRLTACVCMAGACCCALLFAAAPAQGAWPLLAACVFNGVSVGGWNSLDMISAELYPTSVSTLHHMHIYSSTGKSKP